MSERVTGLADQFDQSSSAFLAKVTALSDEEWSTPLNDDPRPAGVVAHHVADGYEATANALQALLGGVDLGLTWEMIHGGNAAHAAANHGVGREETLALLQSNSAKTLTMLRGRARLSSISRSCSRSSATVRCPPRRSSTDS